MKIRGIPVSTPMARPDMMQTNPRSVSYVRGKEKFLEKTLMEAKESGMFAVAHIGPEAPTNGEKIWIDTSEEAEEEIQIAGAKVGQLLAVAEVDADGKPTKLVAVDPTKLVTPNWSANEGEDGYIEGRTHYVDAKGIVHKLNNKFIDADWMATSQENIDDSVVIAEQKLTSGLWKNRQMDIQPGITYDVHINDVVYPCVAMEEDGGVYLGNNTSMSANNLPFCIYWAGGTATGGFFYKNSTLAYPLYLEVTGHSWTEYNKLPEEFLPDGVVKSVNGTAPDEKGNVTVDIPDAVVNPAAAEVGQTIIVKEVVDGKPTKWEAVDYQPRTHYEGIAEVFSGTLTGLTTGEVLIKGLTLKAGETYYVTWNGVEYTCVCVEVPDQVGACYIGNAAIFGSEDTGEPFCIAYGTDDGTTYFCLALSADGIDESTVVVKCNTYIPIPQQYLSNAFPYYINPFAKDDGTITCAETVAELTAIFNSGRLLILKFPTTDEATSHWHLYPSVTGLSDYGTMFVFSGATGYATSNNEVWEYTLTPQEDGTYVITVGGLSD